MSALLPETDTAQLRLKLPVSLCYPWPERGQSRGSRLEGMTRERERHLDAFPFFRRPQLFQSQVIILIIRAFLNAQITRVPPNLNKSLTSKGSGRNN